MTTIEDPRRRLLVLAAVCAALSAVQISVASLNVALPDIGAEFAASQGTLLWVVNAYTVTLAALLLPLGALGDRVGRKPMLVTGLVVFSLAGLAASQAATAEALIALRVVAGVGGAMVLPATLSVITSSFPPEHRGTAIGIWAGVAGSGGLLGLIGASFIVDAVSWHWVFVLILAPAVLALALVVVFVPNSTEHDGHRFDLRGATLSAAAIGGLVLGIQEGPERGWSDWLTVVGLGTGCVAATAWVVLAFRTAHPLLDVRLFRFPAFSGGSFGLLIISGVSFGAFLILLQYLLSVVGFSSVRATASLGPIVVLTLVGATLGPRLAGRFGNAAVVGGGLVVAGLGAGLIAVHASSESFTGLLPGLVVFGLGLGLGVAPSTTAITEALPAEKQGVASAVNDSARELGGALGIAVMGSVLNAGYRGAVVDLGSRVPPEIADLMREGISSAELAARSLPADAAAEVMDAARSAFIDGWTTSMWAGAAGLMAAGICTFVLFRRADGGSTG